MQSTMRLLFLTALALAACTSSSTGTAPFGDSCTDDDDCGSLTCFTDPRFPGGYCTTPCVAGSCPTGAACVSDYGPPLCLDACAGDDECAEGYQCWRGACRPPCSTADECGGGSSSCEGGMCTGVECSVPEECSPGFTCEANRCVPEAAPDAGMPDVDLSDISVDIPPGDCGACDGVCDGDRCLPRCVDRASCGSAALVCAPVATDDDGDGMPTAVPVCIDTVPAGEFLAGRCRNDSDCESSTCYRGQCTEICDDDSDCLPGHTCRMVAEAGVGEFMACWYNGRRDAIEEYLIVDQGGAPGTTLRRGVVAVPPDAISLSYVISQNAPLNVSLAFFNVYDPSGNTLYDLRSIAEGTDQPIRWLPGSPTEAGTMLIPNTDRVTLESGRYSVIPGIFAEGDPTAESQVRVNAIIRRSSDGEGGGELRLRIHIAPGLGFRASNAASVSRLSETIERLNNVYRASGITAVVDSYVDISSNAYSIISSTQGPDSELARMFRLSTPTDANVVNVFLVRGIDEGDGGTLGVAGGIPGPVDIHGTAHSGVVVSFDTDVVGSGGNFPGQILAHELGHYLGLFHSSERSREVWDGEDVLSDTRYGDRRNLMFFAVQFFSGGSVNDRMSPLQSAVIGRNAFVR